MKIMSNSILIETLQKRKNLRQKDRQAHKRVYKSSKDIDVPMGLYEKCPNCKTAINTNTIINNHFLCPHCDNHLRMRAIDRVNMIVDPGTFYEHGHGYVTLNPLYQDGYETKIERDKEKTKLSEAYIYGYAEIDGSACVVGVMDSFFLMGSMGSVVGEKVTKSFEYAILKKIPLILFSASGGARMQEGIFSLMQMAKTSAAAKELAEKKLLFISVLTHPTTGGVTASFAMLGDIILAEPNALIGFAGPRVIEQTIKQTLPEGFQRSEFLEERGFVDKVVDRRELKGVLSNILKMHKRGE
jgi:acetyl-CoA carboxylase carboxyl transferase beta subunit